MILCKSLSILRLITLYISEGLLLLRESPWLVDIIKISPYINKEMRSSSVHLWNTLITLNKLFLFTQ
jgi:hypothetical protein